MVKSVPMFFQRPVPRDTYPFLPLIHSCIYVTYTHIHAHARAHTHIHINKNKIKTLKKMGRVEGRSKGNGSRNEESHRKKKTP